MGIQLYFHDLSGQWGEGGITTSGIWDSHDMTRIFSAVVDAHSSNIWGE